MSDQAEELPVAMHGCQALGLLAAYGALRAKKAVAHHGASSFPESFSAIVLETTGFRVHIFCFTFCDVP